MTKKVILQDYGSYVSTLEVNTSLWGYQSVVQIFLKCDCWPNYTILYDTTIPLDIR